MHSKRLSTVKWSLVNDLCRIIGFGSIVKFQEFFESPGTLVGDKSEVINILGVGGSTAVASFPKNFSEWQGRASASLSKWRTMKEAHVSRLRALAKDFHSSHSTAYEASSALEEVDMVGKVHIQGEDALFGTPQLRHLFQTFTGRSTAPAPLSESSDIGSLELEGDTSLITLARCDAYVCTWLCILVRGAELPKKRHPSAYNSLLHCLIPQALQGILNTCRRIFEKDSSSVNELRVPFRFSTLKDACDKNNVHLDQVPRLDPNGSEFKGIARILDEDQRVCNTLPSSWHEADFYLEKKRVNTVHFYDEDDDRSYCVLRAAFVKKHICSWIGDVRDAFIGTLQAEDGLSFEPLSQENACDRTDSPVEEETRNESARRLL